LIFLAFPMKSNLAKTPQNSGKSRQNPAAGYSNPAAALHTLSQNAQSENATRQRVRFLNHTAWIRSGNPVPSRPEDRKLAAERA
jgi:hypothetical protein